MFEAVRGALYEQINACVDSLAVSEAVREHLDAIAKVPGAHSAFDSQLSALVPDRKPWVIYDHCAALTRIYSILEIFISSLTKDVSEILPEIYASFEDLPDQTKAAYRKGYSKILLEYGEKHHLKEIKLKDLSRTVTAGICNEQPYKLAAEPFLANKRAFRLPQIQSHLTDLGFEKIGSLILSYPAIARIASARPPEVDAFTFVKEAMNAFINARNDAAHTDVTGVWKIQDVKGAAYLIRDLCLAVMDSVETQILELRLRKKQLTALGPVTELHSNGKGIIFTPVICTLEEEGELILVRNEKVRCSTIRSIQISSKPSQRCSVDGNTEVGLVLGFNSQLGDQVYVVREIALMTPSASQVESPTEQDDELKEEDFLEPVDDFVDEENVDAAGDRGPEAPE